MAVRKNLKAFVRYDGNGQVVPGSLVMRKSMPKVGHWVQIESNNCCSSLTTTTTTTTRTPT